MLIALTGLHGSGKSYFANNIIAKYGFDVYNKKELIEYICKEKTGRNDWVTWYREEFEANPERLTLLILSYIDLTQNVVIDAVHSPLEWNIIVSKIPNSELIGIITPEVIRNQRRDIGDEEKDKKRIAYWHNAENECLMTKLDWVFNGGASLELNEQLFKEFMEYCRKKEKILSGGCMDFSDSKINKLKMLIAENLELKDKIKQANMLINAYQNKLNISGKKEENER